MILIGQTCNGLIRTKDNLCFLTYKLIFLICSQGHIKVYLMTFLCNLLWFIFLTYYFNNCCIIVCASVVVVIFFLFSITDELKPVSEVVPTLLPLPPQLVPPHTAVFINEPRLSDFKLTLTKAGIHCEFVAGVLICNNLVAVRRVRSYILL